MNLTNLEHSNKKNADIVICVDITGSMFNEVLLDELKSEIKNLPKWYADYMQENGCEPGILRVKIIAFKDFYFDCQPICESEFFNFCNGEGDQTYELQKFVESLSFGGGGDIPENSLEALALAFKSDWNLSDFSNRHYTLLITDGPPKPLGKPEWCSTYPEDMPSSMEELCELWNGVPRQKRLIIYALGCDEWLNMQNWDKTLVLPITASEGSLLIDYGLKEVIKTLLAFY